MYLCDDLSHRVCSQASFASRNDTAASTFKVRALLVWSARVDKIQDDGNTKMATHAKFDDKSTVDHDGDLPNHCRPAILVAIADH